MDGNETHHQMIMHEVTAEDMSDYITPGFHKRSKAGEVINNNCTYVKTSLNSVTGGSFTVSQSGHEYQFGGGGCNSKWMAEWLLSIGYYKLVTPIPLKPEPDYDMVSSAKAQAWGNVDRSPYSFAEDIAELHETLKFLRDPLGSIRDLSEAFARDITKQYAKKYVRRAKAHADVWLTYQFALSPLVRSACDLIEAALTDIRRSKRQTARGKKVFEAQKRSGPNNSIYQFDASISNTKKVRAGILYEVTNPINDWRYKYGLRFKDIPETMWAILPYSFMVDRLVNISQAIRGITAFLDPNVKILGGWVTTKEEVTWTRTFIDYEWSGIESKSIVPDMERETSFTYNRAKWSPSASDIMPSFQANNLVNSISKSADLIALILQKFRI
jgi:hypothetical protein